MCSSSRRWTWLYPCDHLVTERSLCTCTATWHIHELHPRTRTGTTLCHPCYSYVHPKARRSRSLGLRFHKLIRFLSSKDRTQQRTAHMLICYSSIAYVKNINSFTRTTQNLHLQHLCLARITLMSGCVMSTRRRVSIKKGLIL